MKTVSLVYYTLALCLPVALAQDTACVSTAFIEDDNPCDEDDPEVQALLEAISFSAGSQVCGGNSRERTLRKKSSRRLATCNLNMWEEMLCSEGAEATASVHQCEFWVGGCRRRRLSADKEHQDQFAVEIGELEAIEDQKEVTHHRELTSGHGEALELCGFEDVDFDINGFIVYYIEEYTTNSVDLSSLNNCTGGHISVMWNPVANSTECMDVLA
eukprot:CAMPEP_0198155278 /NCGR_PEP_ID=MMETSP1443-20131203/69052_1 /TAXON_ID=186043 /ORGANISM="Entomoneis sp., Strain CCMP2396" /LENGTH=214 /DNA_ID=CAMNT_0043822023 /DNA_START=102 /DNA_END=746 /DNA_ORIENTATION=-